MPKSKNRRKPRRANPAAQAGGNAPVPPSSTGGSGGAGTPPPVGGTKPAAKKNVGPVQFLRQVREEGRKVTWTSRNETMISTIMVLVMVAIMSAFFLLVDQSLRFVVPMILNFNA